MCLPNTLAHCVLKVMNRDGDAVVLFLILKIKCTVIKVPALVRSLCFVLRIILKTENCHYLNNINQSVYVMGKAFVVSQEI